MKTGQIMAELNREFFAIQIKVRNTNMTLVQEHMDEVRSRLSDLLTRKRTAG